MRKQILPLFIVLLLLSSCDGASESETETIDPYPVQTDIPEPTDEPAPTETPAPVEEIAVKIVKNDDIPKRIEDVTGKGLEDGEVQKVTPEIFYQSSTTIRSAILAANDTLFFGNEKREFIAVDINRGETLWVYLADDYVQTWPVFADGKIIFNAADSLYILDAVTGEEIHKVTYPSGKDRVSDESYSYNDSYVAVSDGFAYFAAPNGDLVAVDINQGEINWSVTAVNPGLVASGVNLANGKLYYVDVRGSLCAVDIEKRQMIYRTQMGDRIFAPLHIDSGKIYAAGRSSKVYCIDGESGEVIWSSHSYDKSTWFSGGSVTEGDTLYTCTSDEHTLVSFNKNTGEFHRIYPTQANSYTVPLLNGTNVVVAATDVYTHNTSYIMEFDTKNHTKLWQSSLSDCVLSSPVIYQGVLYFGSDSGAIYSIKLEPASISE